MAKKKAKAKAQRSKSDQCRHHRMGRALKEARKTCGYTQDEVAEILARRFPARWEHANAQRISHYEVEPIRRFPPASSLEDLCEIYGIPVWKLWQSASTKLDDQQSEIFDSEWLRLGKTIPAQLRSHLMGLMQQHLTAIEVAETAPRKKK